MLGAMAVILIGIALVAFLIYNMSKGGG